MGEFPFYTEEFFKENLYIKVQRASIRASTRLTLVFGCHITSYVNGSVCGGLRRMREDFSPGAILLVKWWTDTIIHRITSVEIVRRQKTKYSEFYFSLYLIYIQNLGSIYHELVLRFIFHFILFKFNILDLFIMNSFSDWVKALLNTNRII